MPESASPRSRARRLWAGAALMLAVLPGCDDAASIPATAPEVVFEGWCVADGRTYLSLSLVDTERADFDLQIRLEGELSGTVAPGATGSGIQGLGSDRGPDGQRHLIEWGAPCTGGPACVDPCPALLALDLPGPAIECTTLPAAMPDPLLVRVYLRDTDDYVAPVATEAAATLPALGACPRL